jgi:hypothetical protein
LNVVFMAGSSVVALNRLGFADTVEGRSVAKRQPYRPLKVRCPKCQEAVPMSGSVVELGGTWALVCPYCKEISIA